MLEFNYERIQARDDDRFYVTFVPKFLGKAGRAFELGLEEEQK